jgi:hypothetical protein
VSDVPKEGFFAVKQYSGQGKGANYGKVEYLKTKKYM